MYEVTWPGTWRGSSCAMTRTRRTWLNSSSEMPKALPMRLALKGQVVLDFSHTVGVVGEKNAKGDKLVD